LAIKKSKSLSSEKRLVLGRHRAPGGGITKKKFLWGGALPSRKDQGEGGTPAIVQKGHGRRKKESYFGSF